MEKGMGFVWICDHSSFNFGNFSITEWQIMFKPGIFKPPKHG